MISTYAHVAISGIRVAVPAGGVRLEDEAAYYGGNPKKVKRLQSVTGMDCRRLCPPGVTAADLCAHAAERLLQDMRIDRASIDALLFLSQSPDYVMPATACTLQHRLGLGTHCAALDVGQGCSGYVYGLWLAGGLLESGAARRVLLLVGDAMPPRDPRNRIIAPVFGDGGSATLVERRDNVAPMRFSLGTDGSGFETIIIPGGRARLPLSAAQEQDAPLYEDIPDPEGNPWRLVQPYMDGGAIFNFSINVVPQHLQDFLKDAGRTPEELDWLILHQANRQIMESIALKLGVPLEKTPRDTFSRYGNLASASIPAALADLYAETPPAADARMLLCGYGVGLSWASCLLSPGELNCAPVIDFVPAGEPETREHFIERWRDIFSGRRTSHAE